MKAKELRELSDDELYQRHRELQQELFSLRRQAVSGQLDKPSRIRPTRREIARVLTILNERMRKGK
ncbi:MAG TPA: 50S ribosomal protein L29 [Kiritimatiellae bacterium]|nr:50S ribosomal protein L29 [Kiritimatiellia bacterium]